MASVSTAVSRSPQRLRMFLFPLKMNYGKFPHFYRVIKTELTANQSARLLKIVLYRESTCGLLCQYTEQAFVFCPTPRLSISFSNFRFLNIASQTVISVRDAMKRSRSKVDAVRSTIKLNFLRAQHKFLYTSEIGRSDAALLSVFYVNRPIYKLNPLQ